MVQYKYAYDSKNNIIDVNDLEKDKLDKTIKFYSIDFRQELIPRLGNKRQKHFAHKDKTKAEGSKETYLHELGKKIFIDAFKTAIYMKKPFYILYDIKRYCNKLEKHNGSSCELPLLTKEYDISKRFTGIKEEKKDDRFKPDVLLYNPDNEEEKIYVEIAVSHKSEEQKIKSGKKIIEFLIQDENDLDNIKYFGELNYDINKVEYHNFKTKIEDGNFCQKDGCFRDYYYFVVYKEGGTALYEKKEKEIKGIRKRIGHNISAEKIELKKFNYEKEGLYEEDIRPILYKYYNALMSKNGYKVKNCFLCRYHAMNTYSNDFEEKLPIFCKFLKKTYRSNDGAKCDYFKREEKYVDEYISNYKELLSNKGDLKADDDINPLLDFFIGKDWKQQS